MIVFVILMKWSCKKTEDMTRHTRPEDGLTYPPPPPPLSPYNPASLYPSSPPSLSPDTPLINPTMPAYSPQQTY